MFSASCRSFLRRVTCFLYMSKPIPIRSRDKFRCAKFLAHLEIRRRIRLRTSVHRPRRSSLFNFGVFLCACMRHELFGKHL